MGWTLHEDGRKAKLQKKALLPTKPGGREDRRRGRPMLRWCDELEEDVAMDGCRNFVN